MGVEMRKSSKAPDKPDNLIGAFHLFLDQNRPTPQGKHNPMTLWTIPYDFHLQLAVPWQFPRIWRILGASSHIDLANRTKSHAVAVSCLFSIVILKRCRKMSKTLGLVLWSCFRLGSKRPKAFGKVLLFIVHHFYIVFCQICARYMTYNMYIYIWCIDISKCCIILWCFCGWCTFQCQIGSMAKSCLGENGRALLLVHLEGRRDDQKISRHGKNLTLNPWHHNDSICVNVMLQSYMAKFS